MNVHLTVFADPENHCLAGPSMTSTCFSLDLVGVQYSVPAASQRCIWVSKWQKLGIDPTFLGGLPAGFWAARVRLSRPMVNLWRRSNEMYIVYRTLFSLIAHSSTVVGSWWCLELPPLGRRFAEVRMGAPGKACVVTRHGEGDCWSNSKTKSFVAITN